MTNQTAVIITLFVLVGISLAIGGNNAQPDDVIADPQINENQNSIKLVRDDLHKIIEDQTQMNKDISLLRQNVTDISEELKTKMTQEQTANFQARMLEIENGLRTLSEKKIIISQPQEPPKKTFGLSLVNAESVPQDIFKLNEIVYIIGDSASTSSQNINIKIRDSDGTVLSDKSVGIPIEGKFTSIYMVPAGSSGTYTVTVSDGNIVDSITFEVQ